MQKHFPFPNNRTRYIKLVDTEKERKVPEGCIDVYQVQSTYNRATLYHGVFRDLNLAVDHAVHLLKEGLAFRGRYSDVYTVAHKAAILLPDGKYHLVHFSGIRFFEPKDVSTPTLDNKEIEDDSPPY